MNRLAITTALIIALSLVAVPSIPDAQAQTDVVINEVVAANDTTLTASYGDTPDWIELHNPTGSVVALDGWVISDAGTSWAFPDGQTIPANGYLVVLASGRSTVTASGEVHTSFSLSRRGETITLTSSTGTLVDRLTYPELTDDMAYGLGDSATAGILASATPGGANGALRPAGVVFDSPSRTFSGSITVSLLAATDAGEAVFYRTDGKAPTTGSTRYSGPINLTKTTTISAAVIDTATGESGPVAHGIYTAVASSMATRTSNLPLLVIDPAKTIKRDSPTWEGSSTWITSTVILIDIGASGRSQLVNTASEAGWAMAKVRGSTSALMARPGMALEFQTDSTVTDNHKRSMLGLAADDDWVLVAAGDIGDLSMINDPFSFELGDRLGVPAMDYRFVEVAVDNNLNGQIDSADMMGLYMLVEKIENGSHRVDVSDGGIRLSLDKPDDCCHPIESSPDDYSVTGMHIIQLEYPNKSDASAADVSWTKSWYADAEASFNRDWDDPDGPQAYVDIDSFLNYWLIQALAGNTDGLRASNYFYMERGEPLVNGPLWDFDRGYSNVTTGWLNLFTIWWYEHLWDYPEFQAMAKARWFELRAPGQPLSNDQLLALARNLDGQVNEVARRSGTTYNPTGFERFLTTRAGWIDSQWRAGAAPTVHAQPQVTTAEEQAVSIQIQVSHNLAVHYDDRSTLPPGLEIDPTTGAISGAVPLGNAGTYRTVITVTDTTGASSSAEFDIIVTAPGGTTAAVLLNEYNGVGASERLDAGGSDTYFGQTIGNGGNWMELVILEDHLDMRGWQIELWDKRSSDLPALASTLTFSQSERLAGLRAGTILTIAEGLADDTSFAPAAGDWTMNFRANAADSGGFVSTGGTGFDTNHQGLRVRFIDADGRVVGPTQGEVEASLANLGDRQVLVAGVDPSGGGSGMDLDIATDFVASTMSTFGEPNRLGLTTQSLEAIRPTELYVDGDVDGDGVTDGADVVDILRVHIGDVPAGYSGHRGDLDGDGVAGLVDAMTIAQCLADPNLISPACDRMAE